MGLSFSNYVLFGSVTIGMVLRVILLFIVCLIVIRILGGLVRKMLTRSKLNDALQKLVASVINAALWVIAIIIIADALGIPTSSLVAVISIAGLALSLSIQNILSNLFSGLTLLFTKPFEAGDFVEIGGKSGTIRSVGLFYTMIETPDKVVISMPNGDVTSSSIQNYSSSSQRRVDLEFSVSYECATEDVKAAIMNAIMADEQILAEPAPFVAIKQYGDSAIVYVTRVWCEAANYWDVHFRMNERVREKFAASGIAMTYNHLNVHIVDNEK